MKSKTKKSRKFFDKEWREVKPERAYFVVELVHDSDGRVLESTTYQVSNE